MLFEDDFQAQEDSAGSVGGNPNRQAPADLESKGDSIILLGRNSTLRPPHSITGRPMISRMGTPSGTVMRIVGWPMSARTAPAISRGSARAIRYDSPAPDRGSAEDAARRAPRPRGSPFHRWAGCDQCGPSAPPVAAARRPAPRNDHPATRSCKKVKNRPVCFSKYSGRIGRL